jgi:predicted enzyme related to lactoylglutathione lyase
MGEMGTYDGLKNREQDFGGVNKLDPAQGAPSHWISYLEVPGNLDDAINKITALGGTVAQPPFEVPTVGRMAVVADPQGAYFSPFEPASSNGMGAPRFPPQKGDVVWHELVTTDPAAAAAFYTGITGLTSDVNDMGTGPYTVLMNGSEMIGGIMQKPDEAPVPAWLIYFEIAQDSIEQALAEVTRLGGQIGMGPMEIPTMGTFAVVGDPTGGWFGLFKSVPQQ